MNAQNPTNLIEKLLLVRKVFVSLPGSIQQCNLKLYKGFQIKTKGKAKQLIWFRFLLLFCFDGVELRK
jgi:hypothetical protein